MKLVLLMKAGRRDFSKLVRKVVIDKNGHKKTVYVRVGLPVKHNTTAGKGDKVDEKNTTPVQHDGEFVLTSSGSKDFGEILPEIALLIRRQAGKIRLRVGKQEHDKGNYGEKHIERPDRLQQLRENGYNNARDFVYDVAQNYTSIYNRDGGGLILYRNIDKKGVSLFVELIPSLEGDFYDVKTGMITRDTYYANKKPLWNEFQNG